MIYTIGNAANYRKAIQEHGTIMKLAGGYAFKNVQDAEEEIAAQGKEDVWAVFGLDGNWDTDVKEIHDRVSHQLISDVTIIDMEFCVPNSHEWELVWKDKESEPGTVDCRVCVYCCMQQQFVRQSS
jgi:predicted dehydrogenase